MRHVAPVTPAGRSGRRIAACALALVAGLLAGPLAPAGAAPGAEVGIEDERLLLSEPSRAPATVREWAALGVDVVRIHARWFEVAPAQESRRRPPGFAEANHRSSRYDWRTLDRAVELVRGSGMRVMLTVTGPGPVWSSESPERANPRYRPDPVAFGRFATAVATRYRDEVDRYLIWNEPNQSGWLQPQSSCSGRAPRRVCVPVAPHVYRGLVRAAGPAIERADRGATVIAGELAPIGTGDPTPGAALAPLRFLRSFACVDPSYRPIRAGACRGFRPAAMDALGYHPHGVRNGPERSNPDRDSAQIADLPRLFRVLDRLTRSGRIRSPGGDPLDLHLTEFSYQTRPPDRAVGITLSQQAIYGQQAAYVAWRTPRVRNLVQYQWDDEYVRDLGSGTRRYAGWQGGLRFLDARPKPALAAYEAPFVADVADDGATARLWGQIRPGTTHEVVIVRQASGSSRLEPFTTLRTGADGVWTLPVEVDAPARWAAVWAEPDGRLRRTAVVRVDPARGGRLEAAVP